MTNTTETSLRVYVTTDSTAEIKAFANTSVPRPYIGIEGTYYPTSRDMLHVSYDGTVFYTVLYHERTSTDRTITQPALGIDRAEIAITDDEIVYNGVTYVLDETATVGEIILKTMMRIVEIVETHLGFYVSAQDEITQKVYTYLNGQPLVVTGGHRARGNVELTVGTDPQGVSHTYSVSGDTLDMRKQVATFDNQPATQIPDPENYEVTFADDMSTATVVKK